ncbi:ABC transporter permease [Bosea sp. (in: a-proteobacteria)]|uniref:ABC transporter permease n=1 Tax=Bosea sp. (in: a-proteobacteria) TaxID=1871050 RepID=UPI002638B826|nr:ABC transporter permease [Bosea sp. (in: a-proteobacteria)]MCO5091696.1 ABC transporter permease [Bosea sp. (in: a-proteobacteria)]
MEPRFSERLEKTMGRLPLVAAVLACLFLIVPLIIVMIMSFSSATSFKFPPPGYSLHYYRVYFSSFKWTSATFVSLYVALATAVLTLALVLPAGFGYMNYRFRGRALLNLVIMLPLMVPHVVSALGYYGYFGPLGLVGTPLGMVLAHTALAIPVTFLVVCAGIKGFDRNLIRAAMISGAGPLRTFFYVSAPVLRPTILVAALFAFLASFNEAVVSIFIGGRDASTLPKTMFESIQIDSDPVIAVVSALLTMAVAVSVVVSTVFSERRKRKLRRQQVQAEAQQPAAFVFRRLAQPGDTA